MPNPSVSLLGSVCRQLAGTMSKMEQSLDTIIDTFHKYSKELNHPDTLTQGEFKKLVQRDLTNFLKEQKRDEVAIGKIMEDLDSSADKQISFPEFIMLIARLAVASHEKMHENAPPGKGHSHGPGLGEGHPGHGHGHCH
ncbi:protein S100-A9 [Erinaceus europaeus]|uniref:Protein S100 n=1 Tax=Erinaceus europaeus TaxID=9365 RepID=A0A1S2ZW11_ERIEU|nr:protein S100-A9 [Erinaceus europaeus]